MTIFAKTETKIESDAKLILKMRLKLSKIYKMCAKIEAEIQQSFQKLSKVSK